MHVCVSDAIATLSSSSAHRRKVLLTVVKFARCCCFPGKKCRECCHRSCLFHAELKCKFATPSDAGSADA